MAPASPYTGLRLLVFQVRPFTGGAVDDGSHAILVDVLKHLGACGVRTTVYCGRRADLPPECEPYPGVTVRAVLRFDDTGRDPYWTAPFHLAEIVDVLRRAADEHDAVYIHDGNLRFDFVGTGRPLITGVFDLVYPHSVAGIVDFSRDRLLTISDYAGACLREVFRRFRPLPDDALHVVNSGFAADVFHPCDPSRLRHRLALPDDALAVLFPHRPESAKGLHRALNVVRLLANRMPTADYARVRLLVPVGVGSAGFEAQAYQELHPEARRSADELGVADKVHPHRWVPRSSMAEYYSAGVAALCLGEFPEAFGNVHVESMLCGTPAILARVAAQRSTVPEDLVRKVDPGDDEAAADQLAEVIGRRERAGAALRDYLTSRYSMKDMLHGYERALLECRLGPAVPLAVPAGRLTGRTRLRIPPWAARLRTGYYCDYSGYRTDPVLLASLDRLENGCAVGELTGAGTATAADVHRWLSEGLVVSDPVVAARPH